MLTSYHHDFDTSQAECTDGLAYPMFRWILKRNETDKAISIAGVLDVLLAKRIILGV
jgi:hypothetical protein